MITAEYILYDLVNDRDVAAMRDRHGLHTSALQKKNRVYVHPLVTSLSGHLGFSAENNEIVFGHGCTFHGEIVSMGSNARTLIRGNQHALNLQAFVYSNAMLDIGPGTVAYGLRVWVSEHRFLTIGRSCLFSEGITIRTTDHHSIFDLDSQTLLNIPADVAIDDHVWVGQDVAILKGVTIGKGAIIGAKALVNRPVPPTELWSGSPARQIRQRVSWLDPHPATADQITQRILELGIAVPVQDQGPTNSDASKPDRIFAVDTTSRLV